MTTAIIISELLPLHDDALIADIDDIFDEIDRSVEPTPADEREATELLLVVDWLVDEMLSDAAPEPREKLAIELEVEVAEGQVENDDTSDEVAEVA